MDHRFTVSLTSGIARAQPVHIDLGITSDSCQNVPSFLIERVIDEVPKDVSWKRDRFTEFSTCFTGLLTRGTSLPG